MTALRHPELFLNPGATREPYTDDERAIVGTSAAADALATMRRCPAHAATPLASLPELASRLGIATLRVKNEGPRFGLQSFKGLGGAYAVAVALEGADRRVTLDQAVRGKPRASTPTFCCASDGNHGRSVAFGARHFGARAHVFVHGAVSAQRRCAMTDLGAEVVVVEGSYDDSVRAAQRAAEEQGWILIADTSAAGDDDVPIIVMRGYLVLVAETCDETESAGDQPFTHVFVQAGVGGLAAAVAGYLTDRYGLAAPKVIVVEPKSSACLLASARAGRPVAVAGDLDTLMAMLSCGEPSPVAWRILARRAHAFMAIDDEAAAHAMRLFARPVGTDIAMRVGESGAAGLAALIEARRVDALRGGLGLDERSHVLLIATEAPTDERNYDRIMQASAGDGRVDAD